MKTKNALTAPQPSPSPKAGGGCLERLVRRFPRRPGNGWKAYKLTPVWEHASGVRVHSLGACRLADGTIINGEHWPECLNLWRAIREQGEFRRLIIEHHSHNVMKDNYVVCPICSESAWNEFLNRSAQDE
jgi:hypothetical protein